MKYKYLISEAVPLGKTVERFSANLSKPLTYTLTVFSLLLVFTLGPFGSKSFCSPSGVADKPLVGFLTPEGEETSKEKSLISGFELFFKERSVDPSDYFVVRKYGNSPDSLLGALAELLKTDKVRVIVTPVELRDALEVVSATAEVKAIVFVTNPAVKFVAGEMCRPNVFRICPNTYVSSQPLAKWAFLNLGHKVFIVNDESPESGEQADFFALGMERIGGSFGDRFVLPKDSSDYDKVFEKLEEIKPDFVFAALSGPMADRFVRTYISKGLAKRFPIIGVGSLTDYPETQNGLEPHWLGIRTLTSIKDPLKLAKSIEPGMPVHPTPGLVAQGYDIANVFYSCIQSDCFKDDSVDKVIDFISKLTIDGLRGAMAFDANREAIVPMNITHWERDSKTGLIRVVDEVVGPCRSLDFGCGGVGFPDRPELTTPEPNQGLWEEHQQ